MTPGYQALQSAHAIVDFQYQHTELALDWFKNSKYLIFLSVQDEQKLAMLASKFEDEGIVFSSFHEPDINNSLTAISTISTERTKRLLSGLPLMLKEIDLDKTKINKHTKIN